MLLDQSENIFLNPDVGASNFDALLGYAILRIIGRYVGQQRHQGVIVVLHRCIQVGIGRLDAATDAAPDIDLPVQVEESEIDPRRMAIRSAVGIEPLQLLGLREEVARRDSLLRSCLQHPCAQDAQTQVLLVSRANQRVERLILEHRPPILDVALLHVCVAGLYPLCGHGSRRLAIIGTDFETVADPLPRSGQDAATAAQNGAKQGKQSEPAQQGRTRNTVSIRLEGSPSVHASSPS